MQLGPLCGLFDAMGSVAMQLEIYGDVECRFYHESVVLESIGYPDSTGQCES